MALIRLNYATEMRYGVLVDLACRIRGGAEIDLEMGHFNVIWQADANAMALASLGRTASPPRVVNIAGPELLSVRRVAQEFGRRGLYVFRADAVERHSETQGKKGVVGAGLGHPFQRSSCAGPPRRGGRTKIDKMVTIEGNG